MSLLLVTTRSGSTYILRESTTGVVWCRMPRDASVSPGVRFGVEDTMPRIVQGEPVFLGDLLTTPVLNVAVMPT